MRRASGAGIRSAGLARERFPAGDLRHRLRPQVHGHPRQTCHNLRADALVNGKLLATADAHRQMGGSNGGGAHLAASRPHGSSGSRRRGDG